MKKALYLGFCLVLAMGVGCAITDYALITDNDQTSNGQGSGVVNTNGKAKIIPSLQVATNWPDGSDELFSMVDQQSDGDRTITTYNNFSTGGDPTFLDDTYCNPDWQGCAIYTADDPQSGDSDPFDGSTNANCAGARSLSSFVGTGRYYGECGRANFSLTERLELGNMGVPGQLMGIEGLMYEANRSNTTVIADNGLGITQLIPVIGSVPAVTDGQKVGIDARNPALSNSIRSLETFASQHGDEMAITVIFEGISKTVDVKVRPEGLRQLARQ